MGNWGLFGLVPSVTSVYVRQLLPKVIKALRQKVISRIKCPNEEAMAPSICDIFISRTEPSLVPWNKYVGFM